MANPRLDNYNCYPIPQSQPDIFIMICVELSTYVEGPDYSYGPVITEHKKSRWVTFNELVNPEEESSVIHRMISSLYPRLDTELWQDVIGKIYQRCIPDMMWDRNNPFTVRITIDEQKKNYEDEEGVMPMDWCYTDGHVKTVKIDEKTELTCSICLEPLMDGTESDRLPCQHMYHDTCIRKWLSTSRFCPMCRFDLLA